MMMFERALSKDNDGQRGVCSSDRADVNLYSDTVCELRRICVC